MEIGKYYYEIDNLNAVRIWNKEVPNEFNKPFFYQPDYPNGTSWESHEAAEVWVINFINELIASDEELSQQQEVTPE